MSNSQIIGHACFIHTEKTTIFGNQKLLPIQNTEFRCFYLYIHSQNKQFLFLVKNKGEYQFPIC